MSFREIVTVRYVLWCLFALMLGFIVGNVVF